MSENKKKLRKAARRTLANLSEGDLQTQSQALSSRLVSWLNAQPNIKKVALFAALPSEVDLVLATQLLANLEWHYPIVNGSQMSFHLVNAHDSLTSGYQGIKEPNPQIHPAAQPEELDLILCPGLAFTMKGLRLGRGGGFYDRYLEQLPEQTYRMGVCYPSQIIDHLPVEPHDIAMTHMLGVDQVSTCT